MWSFLMIWMLGTAWTWTAVFLAIFLMGSTGLHYLLSTLIGSAVITFPATLGVLFWRSWENRY